MSNKKWMALALVPVISTTVVAPNVMASESLEITPKTKMAENNVELENGSKTKMVENNVTLENGATTKNHVTAVNTSAVVTSTDTVDYWGMIKDNFKEEDKPQIYYDDKLTKPYVPHTATGKYSDISMDFLNLKVTPKTVVDRVEVYYGNGDKKEYLTTLEYAEKGKTSTLPLYTKETYSKIDKMNVDNTVKGYGFTVVYLDDEGLTIGTDFFANKDVPRETLYVSGNGKTIKVDTNFLDEIEKGTTLDKTQTDKDKPQVDKPQVDKDKDKEVDKDKPQVDKDKEVEKDKGNVTSTEVYGLKVTVDLDKSTAVLEVTDKNIELENATLFISKQGDKDNLIKVGTVSKQGIKEGKVELPIRHILQQFEVGTELDVQYNVSFVDKESNKLTEAIVHALVKVGKLTDELDNDLKTSYLENGGYLEGFKDVPLHESHEIKSIDYNDLMDGNSVIIEDGEGSTVVEGGNVSDVDNEELPQTNTNAQQTGMFVGLIAMLSAFVLGRKRTDKTVE